MIYPTDRPAEERPKAAPPVFPLNTSVTMADVIAAEPRQACFICRQAVTFDQVNACAAVLCPKRRG